MWLNYYTNETIFLNTAFSSHEIYHDFLESQLHNGWWTYAAPTYSGWWRSLINAGESSVHQSGKQLSCHRPSRHSAVASHGYRTWQQSARRHSYIGTSSKSRTQVAKLTDARGVVYTPSCWPFSANYHTIVKSDKPRWMCGVKWLASTSSVSRKPRTMKLLLQLNIV